MESYDVTEWGKPLQRAVRETPRPGPQEVLIRLTYCGVCHSDVHIRQGYFDMGGGVKNVLADRGMKLPLVLGHEPVGTVEAVGADVKGVLVGQTCLVNPWIGCGTCAACLKGQNNLCPVMAAIGMVRPGGFATHLLVPHARYLVDVSGLDPAQAAVLACSGVTAYSAIEKIGPPEPGQWVGVIGCGGLGLMAIAILRALGHAQIIACDIDDAKLAAAQAAGVQQLVNLKIGGAKELLALPAVQTRPLAQAERSLQDLEAGRVIGRIVLDVGSSP